MVKFYDPNQPEQFLEVPKLCGVFPIKVLVLAMQFIVMLFQIACLCVFDSSKTIIFFQITSIVLNAFTFAAFIVENKILIRTHYYAAAIFTIVPIGFVLFSIILMFDVIFFGNRLLTASPLESTFYLIAGIVVLCAYIFYITMCRRLIKAFDRQPEDLPELDTTQGLFTFNRDAYDGAERVKLIYPEV
ncbi:unnamed protein product [Caenorhabditis brenneri]